MDERLSSSTSIRTYLFSKQLQQLCNCVPEQTQSSSSNCKSPFAQQTTTASPPFVGRELECA